MENITVKELMTPCPALISPESTVDKAAVKMMITQCGTLPVGTDDKLEGIITDRDISMRIVDGELSAQSTPIKEIMSKNIFYCNENDSFVDEANLMYKLKVSRLVVENDNGKVTGILSFGHFANKNKKAVKAEQEKQAAL